jgi:hypothetical protein
MSKKSPVFRMTIAVVIVAIAATYLNATEYDASAASRWGPGGSKDRIQGDAGRDSGSTSPRPTTPGRKTRPRCRSASCKASRSRASQDSSHAEKELVLPKPTIAIDPDFAGMVGTTSYLRVESPALFSDYVGTEDAGAWVEARPSRAECAAGERVLTAHMSRRLDGERAATPPMGLDLDYSGTLVISCRLFWDAQWTSSDGESGSIADRETWNERSYPVGGIVPVLVR